MSRSVLPLDLNLRERACSRLGTCGVASKLAPTHNSRRPPQRGFYPITSTSWSPTGGTSKVIQPSAETVAANARSETSERTDDDAGA